MKFLLIKCAAFFAPCCATETMMVFNNILAVKVTGNLRSTLYNTARQKEFGKS